MPSRTALTPTLLASAMLLAGCGGSDGDDDPVAPIAPIDAASEDVATTAPDASDPVSDTVVVMPADDDAPSAPDTLAVAPRPGPDAPDAPDSGAPDAAPVVPARTPGTAVEVGNADPASVPVPADGPEPDEAGPAEPDPVEPEPIEAAPAEPETTAPEPSPMEVRPEVAEPEASESEAPEEADTGTDTAELETPEPELAESGPAEVGTVEPEAPEPAAPEVDSTPSDPGVPTAPVSPPPVSPPPVSPTPVAGPPAGTPPEGNVPDPSEGSLPLPDDLVDNSPTRAESLSLLGPSRRDASRGAGAPSAPGQPTALLLAGDYVEFSWAPSVDDGAVVAYEIYRDGELLRTVEDGQSSFYERKNWLSTSYIDCNYTRDTACEVQQPASGSTHEYYVVAVDDEGSSSEASAPATFSLTPQAPSELDLSGYSVVFEDEFDGDSLDRSKWKTALPWGPDTIINGEQQYYANLFGSDPIDYDPFVFDGDTMSITGVPTPPELSDDANGQPYLSGNLTTADKFSMTYGYVEMNAKLASGGGLLSTFYLFNADYERNKPEIDIVEYIGDRPSTAYQTYHYYDSLLLEDNGYQGVKHSTPTMATDVGSDLGSEFHTYGVLWEEELMVWYIDGVEVRRITGPRVSDEPMNIIAHLVIGSNWIGEPNPSNGFPVEFEIDYIRAYQRAN